jgi:hypothetical protein
MINTFAFIFDKSLMGILGFDLLGLFQPYGQLEGGPLKNGPAACTFLLFGKYVYEY